ncbi:PP2C family protein-serine/threonine phosphatase [Lentzea sp. BCCO 10_0856]|uniref:PP2C family protein-serine/threonine phosphatase n=1 Tax=Lentzea miocenica TaxID=3095431 RepID=A0ABU4T7T4_9PSEU|nr:PP2C family protein-serine/threonine phosphatase [Lentzea sp. BCCO 10_0856]MDX8034222.1 PP2C family protein-serine/threonine phosphatase [Lentzea sp. BCCO 10_0856]
MTGRAEDWNSAFRQIINGAHLATAGDLAALLDEAAAKVGITAHLYIVDVGQQWLRSVRSGGGPALRVDSTTAGRAFQRTDIITVRDSPPYLWLPVLNGTERLGVLQTILHGDGDPGDQWIREHCWELAGLLGHLIMSKLRYSDFLHVLRRTTTFSVASELLWQLLPPQTFACDQLTVTAVMEPYHAVGGDGYDYSVDNGRAHVSIFDAMGHDMHAGLTTAVALAATRNARRNGLGLLEGAELADEAVRQQATEGLKAPFATAVLADLDLATGVVRYVLAGHPPALVLRGGRMVKALKDPVTLPLGLGHLTTAPRRLGREQLQAGDRILLHSDGVTEARDPRGEQFGVERLVDLTERHEAAGLPAPETLRRVSRAVLDHQRGRLQDDATLLLLEWGRTAARNVLP